MNFSNIIGMVGAALILLPFVMLKTRRWSDKDLAYDLTNFVGSSLLAVSAYLVGGYPFVVLNVIWAIMSMKDVVMMMRSKK